MNIEVIVQGHLPLALSRECYTNRALNHSNKNCDKECYKYPKGFYLKAIYGELLYKINGPQIFSAKVHCLIEYMDYLKKLKVESIRIESQLEENTAEVINIYREVLDNNSNENDAISKLEACYKDNLYNGVSQENRMAL